MEPPPNVTISVPEQPHAAQKLRANFWERPSSASILLTNVVCLFAVMGSFAVMVGDLREDYKSLGYILGENLLVGSAVICCVWALISYRFTSATQAVKPVLGKLQIALASVIAILAILSIAIAFHRQLSRVDWIIAFGMGGGLGVLLSHSASPVTQDQTSLSTIRVYEVYLLLGVLLNLGMILRWLAPGSIVLTWLVTPINALLVPGLSLGFAFLPKKASWIERLIYAPALSLAVQLISLMWLTQLGIPITLTALSLVTILSTIGGFVIVLWRHR